MGMARETIEVMTPANAALDLVVAALAQSGAKIDHVNSEDFTVKASKGVSLLSWGERLTATVVPVGPNGSRVEVTSKSAMPIQFLDWGKNTRNVRAIAQDIRVRAGGPTAH